MGIGVHLLSCSEELQSKIKAGHRGCCCEMSVNRNVIFPNYCEDPVEHFLPVKSCSPWPYLTSDSCFLAYTGNKPTFLFSSPSLPCETLQHSQRHSFSHDRDSPFSVRAGQDPTNTETGAHTVFVWETVQRVPNFGWVSWLPASWSHKTCLKYSLAAPISLK